MLHRLEAGWRILLKFMIKKLIHCLGMLWHELEKLKTMSYLGCFGEIPLPSRVNVWRTSCHCGNSCMTAATLEHHWSAKALWLTVHFLPAGMDEQTTLCYLTVRKPLFKKSAPSESGFGNCQQYFLHVPRGLVSLSTCSELVWILDLICCLRCINLNNFILFLY